MAKAVTGVFLVGGALGAIFWWNQSALRGTLRSAPAAEVPAVQAQAPAESHATTQPATLTTPNAVTTPTPSAPGVNTPGQPVAPPTVNGVPGAGVTPTTRRVTEVVPPSPITAGSPEALRQGQELATAGRLVEARKVVNDALVGDTLTQPGDVSAAKAMLRELNTTLLFSPNVMDGDPWVEAITIKSGDRLDRIANTVFVPSDRLMQINGIRSDRAIRVGQKLKVIRGPFHAVVDKRTFTLDIYLGAPGGPGSMYVTTFRVGLGANDSTPAGLWVLERGNKLRNPTYHSPRGEGVIAADDPANPLGEYWIGLKGLEGEAVGKLSYGIHGTIEPHTIGTMASMGCIRLVNEDVAQVFSLLYEVKSTVRVVE